MRWLREGEHESLITRVLRFSLVPEEAALAAAAPGEPGWCRRTDDAEQRRCPQPGPAPAAAGHPRGHGCSADSACARKTTLGEATGRELMGQNIYIPAALAAEAVFQRKLPRYVTG